MNNRINEKYITQSKITVPKIEIDDSYDYSSGGRLIANIIIRIKDGVRNYTLERTRNGGYQMK